MYLCKEIIEFWLEFRDWADFGVSQLIYTSRINLPCALDLTSFNGILSLKYDFYYRHKSLLVFVQCSINFENVFGCLGVFLGLPLCNHPHWLTRTSKKNAFNLKMNLFGNFNGFAYVLGV